MGSATRRYAVLALATSVAASFQPKYPIDPKMVKGCTWFFDNGGADVLACKDVPAANDCTLQQFLYWNPSVGPNCDNFPVNQSYCVEGPPPPVTTTSKPPTTTRTSTTTPPPSSTKPSNGITTPTPTQPGMVDNCNKFYFVKNGESCEGITRANGISLTEFSSWNKDVGDKCDGLWANVYACVSVIG
ncbi:hypothetical protein NLG97_g6143 [Lecanicillium saksenae]|uniref:Uncharacterized protein n=1 Tax=Lecanicillium saksenae TaxID=468837 RepID=A0ACC1QSC3_9HYPO|nr:hypothetical protein NLG97_g6143 [Lecanicillium saksenae]